MHQRDQDPHFKGAIAIKLFDWRLGLSATAILTFDFVGTLFGF